jgi:hypothetical protein
LREFLDVFCSAFFDDILIYSDGSREDHMEKVRKVIERLLQAGLRLDPKKCEFAAKEVRYLGFIVKAGVGIEADEEKLRAIREWEAPTSAKGVRSFLGFCNFIREFIDGYSDLEAPLQALLKKGVRFRWGEVENAAFERLKSAFCKPPVLAQWDPSKKTVMEADSSGWATGACLLQRDDTGTLRPVAYHSQQLSPAECNYKIHDKELLAIIRGMKAWDAELRSVTDPFTILSDHSNLQYFFTKRRLTERQFRWWETMLRYRFKLKFRPGQQSPRPDALSRREQDVPTDPQDERIQARHIQLISDEWIAEPEPPDVEGIGIGTMAPSEQQVFEDPELQRLWSEACQHDAEYPLVLQALEEGRRCFPPEVTAKVSIAECSLGDDGLPRFRDRRWIPAWEPLQTALTQVAHDSAVTGHPGRDGTIAVLSRNYYWPGLSKFVRRFVRNCHVCRRTTVWRDQKKGLLKPLPVPDRFWNHLSIDFMTDLPAADQHSPRYIMVITDRLQKGVIIEAMHSMKAEDCAERFINCFWRFHGFPKSIVSDRGSNWVGDFWRHLCALVGIEQRLSTAYHPQTDGATERANQEVLAYLRAFVSLSQLDWPKHLPAAQLAINNRDTSSIGLSPFFLTHGYHIEPIQEIEGSVSAASSPRGRAEAFINRLREGTEFAQAAMAAAQQRQEDAANTRRAPAEKFQVGDKVWLSLRNIGNIQPSKKLGWLHAQYTVTEVCDSHTVTLNVPSGIHPRFHVDLLRRASSDPLPSQRQDDAQPPPVISEDGEEEYAVEEIIRAGKRGRGRGAYRGVLVKWKGWAEPTWEPLENMQDTEALDAFENTYGPADTNDGPPAPKSRKELAANPRRGRQVKKKVHFRLPPEIMGETDGG